MAAKGIAPGLRPHDAVSVLVALTSATETSLRETAEKTLANLPGPLLAGALNPDLQGPVLGSLILVYVKNAEVMEKILALPQLPLESIAAAAGQSNEAVSELIATNEERLLKHPPIIERLYMNKATRMSTADRILELAVRNKVELPGIPAYAEAAQAIQNELIVEATPEPTPDDELFTEVEGLSQAFELTLSDDADADTHRLDEESGEEVIEDRFLPMEQRLKKMSVSHKIRRAMLGSAAERMILVRDRNKLVAQAVARSPLIQENEVVRITANRNAPDAVLTIFARSKQWVQSHIIKWNLVTNPRTPFAFSAKLIAHLRDHELKAIMKSKNVTGQVVMAARQALSRREKK